MKKYLSLLLLAALTFPPAATAATKTITPGKFSKISVSTAVRVHFTKGTSTQVRLEADNDFFSEVDVTNQGGLLSIVNKAKTNSKGIYDSNNSNSVTLNVWITAPEVTGFKATVGSSITIENASYSVSGPLDIDISVGSSFKAQSLSASSITLKNTVGSNTTISDLKSQGVLKLENTVGSRMTVNDINAKDIFDFASGPSCNTTFTNVSANSANLQFNPTDRFNITQRIDAGSIFISGSVNANINLNGINAKLVEVKGGHSCNITLAGKTDELIQYGNQGSINSSKLELKSFIKNSNRTVEIDPQPSSADYNFNNYVDYYQYYADYYNWAADYYKKWADYCSDSSNEQYKGYVKEYLNSAKYYEKEAEKYQKLAASAHEKSSANSKAYGKRSKNTATTRSKTSNKGLSRDFGIEYGTVNYEPQNWNGSSTVNEKRQTTTLKTGLIKRIEASSGISVYYRQGPLKPVEITVPISRQKDINVFMEGTTLNVEKVKGSSWKGEFVVTVQAPDVNSFDLSSGCILTFTGDYSINGAFNLDMSSGSNFNASSVRASNISIDLSSGSSISVPVLKASDGVLIDLSSGCNIYTENIEAQKKIILDFSSGVNGNIGSLKASHCVVDLSSGCNFHGNQAIADVISLNASSAATATLSGIQASNINASASSSSTVTLAGKCDTLCVDSDVISNSGYYGHSNKGRIDIDSLEVKSGIMSNSRSNSRKIRVYDYPANGNYYDYSFDGNEDTIINTSETDSGKPKTEKEKVAEAVKALKALGFTDDQIKRALSNSGLDLDLIGNDKEKTADKEKKEYTDDDLIP